jgi:hypothetical protein
VADKGDTRPRRQSDTLGITELLRREAQFVEGSVKTAPHNESAWSYLCGMPVIVCQALASVSLIDSGDRTQDGAVVGTGNVTMTTGGSTARSWLDERAVAGYADCGRSAGDDLGKALASFASAALSMALDAVQRHPACVPARVALLRLQVDEAVHNSDPVAREVASRNAQQLSRALQAMDPIHRLSYAALSDMCNS